MDDVAAIRFDTTENTLVLAGRWRAESLAAAERFIRSFASSDCAVVDATAISAMDTAGAYLLLSLQQKMSVAPQFVGLKDNHQSLLVIVSAKYAAISEQKTTAFHPNFFYRVGKNAFCQLQQLLIFLTFLGEVIAELWGVVMHPLRLQWRSMLNEIDVGGYRALPIIAVMMCLIGVVIAYQLGVQLRIYAANLYVVDLSGVAILREFSPLIVSVIIAGRTSTSFAALIGTMKVNEEIDALRTMGLSPIERLVLPKIVGLLLALPLLIVWGDIFGLFGSMIMAKSMMGINFYAFLERFQQEVAIKHLYLGLLKTPVFALIIAGIGCYQGFQAEGSAQSVGARTTTAAVQAIFLIILSDGIFSIVFNWLGV